ncbi:Desulfoferrodoxin [bioreactor metagenome]|uniref:Desulfoferrodoxin n=1 Tax=bioreactor metagenome TaxID=1076179 RepID=A0A645ENM2_9ZZZZ|nr:desulfoferrodoxin family protein [Candidatus Metalachnospira sp.]
MKFYICKHCKNIITYIMPSGVKVICCGEEMTELIPGAVDAALEKHVPVVTKDGNKVTVEVGSVAHPMIPEHYITFIAIETKQGSEIKYLKAGDAPKAEFLIADGDEFVAAYAYCNLHGLWKA